MNTESLESIADSRGWMTQEAVSYLCRLLNESNPRVLNVYLSQGLSNRNVRKMHAQLLNLKIYDEVSFIFNRSKDKLFDDKKLSNLGHHWSTAKFLKDGTVVHYDSLYHQLPSNLKYVLEDYYEEKFDRKVAGIRNISCKQNSPVQRDGYLCGFIAMMFLIVSQDEDVMNMFLKRSIFPWRNALPIIFQPSANNLYMRRIFQTLYSEHRISIDFFWSIEGKEKLLQHNRFDASESLSKYTNTSTGSKRSTVKVKPEQMSREDIVTLEDASDNDLGENRDNNINLQNMSNQKESEDRSNREESEDRSRSKESEEISIPKNSEHESNMRESEDGSNQEESGDRSNQDESETSSNRKKSGDKSNSKLSDPVSDLKETENKSNLKKPAEKIDVVAPNFLGTIVEEHITGFQKSKLVNNDGYIWKNKTQKLQKGRRQNLYQCVNLKEGKRCNAVKRIVQLYKSKGRNMKKIEYISIHSFCEPKMTGKVNEKSHVGNFTGTKQLIEENDQEKMDHRSRSKKSLVSNIQSKNQNKDAESSNPSVSKSEASNHDNSLNVESNQCRKEKMPDKKFYQEVGQEEWFHKEFEYEESFLNESRGISDAKGNKSIRPKTSDSEDRQRTRKLEGRPTSMDQEDRPRNKESEIRSRRRKSEFRPVGVEQTLDSKESENENSQELDECDNLNEEAPTKASATESDNVEVEVDPRDYFDTSNISLFGDERDSINSSKKEKEAPKENVISFKVRNKELLLPLVQYDGNNLAKFYVDKECAIVIKSKERKNFDSMKWGGWSGGTKLNKGISTMKCQDGSFCSFRKKRWDCMGSCHSKRFCCNFFEGEDLVVTVYLGKHNHDECTNSPTVHSEKVKYDEIEVLEKDADEVKSPECSDEYQTPSRQCELCETSAHKCEECHEKVCNFCSEIHPKYENEMKRIHDKCRLMLQSDKSEHSCPSSIDPESQNDEQDEEKKIYDECISSFPGNNIEIGKINCLVAHKDNIYILKRSDNGGISSEAKDGYLYKIQTTSLGMKQVLPEQEKPYEHSCKGRWVCYKPSCPVVNRLTVLNSVPNKKGVAEECRFCKSKLIFEKCEGKRYILRSKISDFFVVKYVEKHSCGEPEPVIEESVIEELKNMFTYNPELTPSGAYKSLLMKKIQEGKSPKEILNVVAAFTFDFKSKNLKANVKKAMSPDSNDLAAVFELQKLVEEMPELGIKVKVATDSYICEECDIYTLAENLDENEELSERCSCGMKMFHTGPQILLTSVDQIKAAHEMTVDDGQFKYSTLYIDNQNGRLQNFNTLNTFFYDYQMQSITSIFTSHSKFEDKYSIALSFKMFDKIFREVLKMDRMFFPWGFCSDSAGGISAGLIWHFGPNIRHRTCSFHFLYGAHLHCTNAIGSRDSQIRFLRFSFQLLEAATPSKFELLYKEFVNWICKTKDRKNKLLPWLKWWYQRKTQWSTAYTDLELDGVNLAEGGQSKYRMNNNLKKLQLYRGCIYEIGDYLLYSSRLKAMTHQNFVGKGPSKEILDQREALNVMERVKDHFLTQEDLDDLFENYLGIRPKKKIEDVDDDDSFSSTPPKKRPFLLNDFEKLDSANARFTPNSKSPYTYKSPRVKPPKKNPSTSRRPGRPKGTYKKRPGRHDSINAFSFDEACGDNIDDDSPVLTSRKRKFTPVNISSESEEELFLPAKKSRPKTKIIIESSDEEQTGFVGDGVEEFEKGKFQEFLDSDENGSDLIEETSSDCSLPDPEKHKPTKQQKIIQDEIPNRKVRRDRKKDSREKGRDFIEETSSDCCLPDHEKIKPTKQQKLIQDEIPNRKVRRDRKKDSNPFTAAKKKAQMEAKNYLVKKVCFSDDLNTIQKNARFEVNNRSSGNKYNVTFDIHHINCDCEAFKHIKLKRHDQSNDICKHVALVVLHCHENLRDSYHGQRFFSTRNRFKAVFEMLKSFDESRDINEKKKHDKFSLYPTPIPNPSKKFKYFTQKDAALNALKREPIPHWFAEKYNRESKRGDVPQCKVCPKKIKIGTLCIRIDQVSLFQNPNFRPDDFTLLSAAIRVCPKVVCVEEMNKNIRNSKSYKEASNIVQLLSVELARVEDDDRKILRNLFKNVDVEIY